MWRTLSAAVWALFRQGTASPGLFERLFWWTTPLDKPLSHQDLSIEHAAFTTCPPHVRLSTMEIWPRCVRPGLTVSFLYPGIRSATMSYAEQKFSSGTALKRIAFMTKHHNHGHDVDEVNLIDNAAGTPFPVQGRLLVRLPSQCATLCQLQWQVTPPPLFAHNKTQPHSRCRTCNHKWRSCHPGSSCKHQGRLS